VEYGFGLKLADYWTKKEKRNKAWTFLLNNIHEDFLHEPLKFFIRELQNPDEFINCLLNLNENLVHSNLMLSADLAFEVKDKLKENFLTERLLKPLIGILESSTPFSESNKFELWRAIGMLGETNYLKNIFISEIKKRRSLEAKLSEKELAESDRRMRIRAMLVENIALSKDTSTISCLKEILDMETDGEVRYNIAEGLCILGESDYIISYLFQLFEDEIDKKNKIVDLYTIETFGDYRVIVRLRKLYKSETDIEFKLRLIRSIAWLGGKGTTKMLDDLFYSHEFGASIQTRKAEMATDIDKTKIASSFFKFLNENVTDLALKEYFAQMVDRITGN
jgi:hypothetical protein